MDSEENMLAAQMAAPQSAARKCKEENMTR